MIKKLKETYNNYQHHNLDICNRNLIYDLFKKNKYDLIIHCAAQPSHDKAKEFPTLDFEVNALGTVNLLEATRLFCKDSVFIFMSTNKVYGDAPNEYKLEEKASRFDYLNDSDYEGIDENCRIDKTTHSIFGASKVQLI